MDDGGVKLFDAAMTTFRKYYRQYEDFMFELGKCRQAAKLGHTEAQYIIDRFDNFCAPGYGIHLWNFCMLFESDSDNAISLYIAACCQFAIDIKNGELRHVRDLKYETTMKRSAEMGFRYAQYAYAKHHERPYNAETVYYWMRMAADQNFPGALWYIAKRYRYGNLDYNKRVALEQYERAAFTGHSKSMKKCATLYQKLAKDSLDVYIHNKYIFWICECINNDIFLSTFSIPFWHENLLLVIKDQVLSDKFMLGESYYQAEKRSINHKDNNGPFYSPGYYAEEWLVDEFVSVFKKSTNATYRAVIYFLVLCKKYRPFPREISLIIAKEVWASRRNPDKNGWYEIGRCQEAMSLEPPTTTTVKNKKIKV